MFAHTSGADEGLGVSMLVGALWLGWVGWRRLRHRGFERVPRWAAAGFVLAALTLAASSAVVPRAIFGPAPAAPGPRIASPATLTFREPVDGARIGSDDLRVVLDLLGAEVSEGAAGPVSPTTGHLHLTVDGTLVSMSYGTIQTVDLRPFGPGMHTIEAEFVAIDHLPFGPPVVTAVTIDRGAPA